jgi:hypothetical protein
MRLLIRSLSGATFGLAVAYFVDTHAIEGQRPASGWVDVVFTGLLVIAAVVFMATFPAVGDRLPSVRVRGPRKPLGRKRALRSRSHALSDRMRAALIRIDAEVSPRPEIPQPGDATFMEAIRAVNAWDEVVDARVTQLWREEWKAEFIPLLDEYEQLMIVNGVYAEKIRRQDDIRRSVAAMLATRLREWGSHL